MKIKHVITTLALAGLMGAGAFAGIKASGAERKNIEPAYGMNSGETFYFEANSTWGGSYSEGSVYLWTHFYQSSGSGTYDVRLEKLSGNIFYGTWPDTSTLGLDRIMFSRGNSSSIQWDWNNESWAYSFDFIQGGNNYLKQNSSGWYDKNQSGDRDIVGYMEYRPSLDAGKAYLRGSWTGGWADLSKEMTLKSENVYEIENVLLTSGSQIKAITIDSNHFVQWYDASSLSGNSGATFDNPNITINTTGNYTVTVNISTKAYNVDVYEDVDLTAAEGFADDFKTSMGKYCPVVGTDPAKGAEKLATEWGNFATTFAGLSEGAQGYLRTLEDGGKIEEFRERYDSILTDYYSSLSSHDFLNRAEALGLESRISSPFGNASSNNANAVIIIVISSISLVSVLGLGLMIKRKKADR